MYEVYLCDLSPIGECPFAFADCRNCQGDVVYEEGDMITVKAEATPSQSFEGFKLEDDNES